MCKGKSFHGSTPCAYRAKPGSDWCGSHDPDRPDKVARREKAAAKFDARLKAGIAEERKLASHAALVSALERMLESDDGDQCAHGAEWGISTDDACACDWWRFRVQARAALRAEGRG